MQEELQASVACCSMADGGDEVTGPGAATARWDARGRSARRTGPADHASILLVELSGGALDFHRLVATLHRKHVGFTSLLFSSRRALVRLTPDHRSTELLVSVIEREPVVISVEVRYIDPAVVDGVVDQLLGPCSFGKASGDGHHGAC